MITFNGERYIANLHLPEISYEHWHRYIWASQFAPGKRVIDIACGEGYGSNLLAQNAEHVIGVDIDAETISYASSRYIRRNLEFLQGSASKIPIDEQNTFHIVTSFETIEHLRQEDQLSFMKETKRLLHSEGVLIMSTPNKLFYSDVPGYKNEFHVREFYFQEYIEFARQFFAHVYVLAQRVYPSSYIWPLSANPQKFREHQLEFTNGHFEPTQTDKKEPLYLLVVCSDQTIETLDTIDQGSILLDISDQAIGQRKIQLEETDKAVALLHGWIDERDQRIQKDEADIARLQAWIAERDEHIVKQTADIGAFHTWIAERDEHIAKQAADISALQDWVTQRKGELSALYQQLHERSEQHEELAARFSDVEKLLMERDEHILKLHAYATEQAQELGRLQYYLHGLHSSIGWKILTRIVSLRERVRRAQGLVTGSYRLTRRASQVWREQGSRAVLQKARRRILRRGAGQYAAPISVASVDSAQDMQDVYQRWIEEHEPSKEQLEQQAVAASELTAQPLISILTPVYNPEPAIIKALIESVTAQTYMHWELWLLDGSANNRQVSDILQRYAATDERIHLVSLERNQGIVGNTNLGLPRAGGEFVAFVDHDDVLAPFALYEVARLLNEQPQTDLIYSDSDLLSSDGTLRFQPLFKPDWSPAIMLSANYATHLCVVRTKLLVELGGLTPGSDGAQDWDLILRVSEHTSAIAHIPKILYHWRESLISTATDIKRKPYVMSAQLTAITQHLQRQGLAAHAFFDTNGFIRVTWPLLRRPLVSIIIPSRNPELLQRCINSILTRTSYQEFEILLIDTTPKGTIHQRYADQRNPHLRVTRNTQPFNYSAVNNMAARSAKGDLLLFLNDDTEVIDSEWLTEMVRWAEREQIGVVGAKLLYEDGRIQHAGVVIGLDGFAGHPFAGGYEGQHTIYGCVEWYRNYSAITGACLMMRRALFEQVGGFDEDLVLCGNDVELCLRVRSRGYQVFYTPFARLRHHESATRGASAIPPSDYERSYQHYLPLLSDGDPYYNANLSPWSVTPQFHQRSEQTALAFVQQFLRQLPRQVERNEPVTTP